MPRIDDVQQLLQQSIDDLQGQINSQSEQISIQLAAQRDTQEHSSAQLRELITGLSVQLMQLVNRTNDNGGNNLSRLSRVDFPKFEGEDIQGWIYRCEQFFELDSIAENRRVKIASIHLSGRALVWHQSYMRGFAAGVWPTWDEYRAAITARFGIEPFDDPLAELMKLKQLGSVAQYQEKFDVLLNRVDLSITQAISCFLSGLCEEIQCAVRMFRPASLHDAYCLAKLQEATLASITKRNRPILSKPSGVAGSFNSYKGPSGGAVSSSYQKFAPRTQGSGSQFGSRSVVSSTGSVTSRPRRILTSKEIDEKRANNMCFFCDEKYYPGHQCKGQVYSLEVMEEEEGMEMSEEGLEGSLSTLLQEDEQPLISLQALQGMNSFQTMRVIGRAGSQAIHILVDSGSTHNFLDATTAKRLRCELQKIPPLVVAVAGGAQLQCQTMCKGFTWTLLGTEYRSDAYIVSLSSCDMVLGVQWLSTLGSILWNFENLTMEFFFQGKETCAEGHQEGRNILDKGKGSEGYLPKSSNVCNKNHFRSS